MEEDTPRNLSGHFLVSEISLADPNFRRSVVLMILHDENGAFGLVVNHPSPFTLGDLIAGVEGTPAAAIPVFVGGPVQQEVLSVLHAELPGYDGAAVEAPVEGVSSEPATKPLIEYLVNVWSAMPEAERPSVRLYAGYSGWGPGQVEGEMRTESWVVVKATSEMIFRADPAGAWEEAFSGKGPLYKIILQTGFKPSNN